MDESTHKMNVLLLYSAKRLQAVRAVAKLLDNAGIDSFMLEIGSCPFAHLSVELARTTHILLIPVFKDLKSLFVGAAAGYALARNQSIHLLWRWEMVPDPFSFDQVHLSKTGTDLSRYFKNEKELWEKQQATKEARESLKSMAIDFTELAFCQAVEEGALKAVELFVHAGFSTNVASPKGIPVLNLAVRNEHLSITRFLIQKGADVSGISSDRGNTALMDAASAGNLELLDMLIGAGSPLNDINKSGQTALILAAGQGNTDLAAHLLEAGADYKKSDSLGMTVKKYAILFKNQKIVSMLAELESREEA